MTQKQAVKEFEASGLFLKENIKIFLGNIA